MSEERTKQPILHDVGLRAAVNRAQFVVDCGVLAELDDMAITVLINAAHRLADVERERERLRDCLSNVQEWLLDRASRLGAVGLYPDDLAEEVEAVLAQADTKER